MYSFENHTAGGPWAPAQSARFNFCACKWVSDSPSGQFIHLSEAQSLCAYKSLDAYNYVLCAERDVPSWDIEHFTSHCSLLRYNSSLVCPIIALSTAVVCPMSEWHHWETHLWSRTGNPLGTGDERISKFTVF